MKKCCMILADGFEEVEAVAPYGILARGGVQVDRYALNGTVATGRYGTVLSNLTPLNAFSGEYEAIILPGGPGHSALKNDPRVLDLIKAFERDGKFLCAICASPTIFGEMGILTNKCYTCFTSMDANFGGSYRENYVVRDGKLITGKSVAASIDFGLSILDAVMGRDVANKIKTQIYYDQRD